MTGFTGGATPPSNDPRRTPEKGVSAGEYAGLGIQFAASIVVFLYIGQWLDRKLGTAPWLLLAGVFVGAGPLGPVEPHPECLSSRGGI
jgi:F0F1-type ATP synthase assembly protein I